MTKTVKKGKTVNQGICDWFFKVVEAQRTLNSNQAYVRNGKELVEVCLGNDRIIHIYEVKQFDRLVEALMAVYGEDFVGTVKEDISKIPSGGYVWRSFNYAEFNVGTIVRHLEKEEVKDAE